jgi:hypothetical protein
MRVVSDMRFDGGGFWFWILGQVESGNGDWCGRWSPEMESCYGVLDIIRNRGLRWGTGSRKDEVRVGEGEWTTRWDLGFVIRVVLVSGMRFDEGVEFLVSWVWFGLEMEWVEKSWVKLSFLVVRVEIDWDEEWRWFLVLDTWVEFWSAESGWE